MISEEEVEKQYQYMKALGDDISKEEVKEELEKYGYVRPYCERHPLDKSCLKRLEFREGKAHLVVDIEKADNKTIACLMQSKGIVITTEGDTGTSGKKISKKEAKE